MPVRPVGEVVGAPGAERVLLHAEVVYDGIGLPRPDAAVLLQAREGGYWLSDVRDHAATARTFPEAPSAPASRSRASAECAAAPS